jgi:hypothetical protein
VGFVGCGLEDRILLREVREEEEQDERKEVEGRREN